MLITSTHNPRVKAFLQLAKPGVRKEEGLFSVEGLREIERAIASGYTMLQLFHDPSLLLNEPWRAWQKQWMGDAEYLEVSRPVFNRIAYREDSQGVIAVFRQKSHHLAELEVSVNPLFLVVEAIEKPGNLGALLRTADAAGLSGLILCDPRTDLYNPNVIRSSIGCVFTLPIAIARSEDTIKWLKENNIRILTTSLNATQVYDQADFRKPTAIVMGTEDQGVTEHWEAEADETIIIPMRGKADSLNVSVSAAIIIFEACRQRGFI